MKTFRKMTLIVLALALVMSFGMMSIINNVQDIVRMRRKNAFIPKFSL